jgi:hypothetical protein
MHGGADDYRMSGIADNDGFPIDPMGERVVQSDGPTLDMRRQPIRLSQILQIQVDEN